MADNLNFITTTATLASSVAQLLVARNNARQYLAIQNTGVGAATFGFRVAPTAAGVGISLDPAVSAGGQGGSWEWVTTIPTNPVYGYSAAGTTVVVVEG